MKASAELTCVSLFVRLWVEIRQILQSRHLHLRQPLREAVSWNYCINIHSSPPYLSASSWGCELKFYRFWILWWFNWSASSWGCELKWEKRRVATKATPSASSWGCELKYGHCYGRRRNTSQPLREAVSWNIVKSFDLCIYIGQPLREAVSWNINSRPRDTRYFSQPLREAVSWNVYDTLLGEGKIRQPLREAVSWNVDPALGIMVPTGQPLREAVSWNIGEQQAAVEQSKSASSWGCELK